jgi:hypothetical protein
MNIGKFYIWFFLLSAQSTFSQDYHAILNKNNSWDVLGMTVNETGVCGYGFGSRYVISGDTFLNGHYYESIRSYGFISGYFGIFCPPYTVSTSFTNNYPEFYLREDTLQRKIFLFDTNEEILLFDFNAQIGDSLQSNPFSKPIVTAIDSVALLNGEVRKRFYIGMQPGEFTPYAIEGIGFTCGFRIYFLDCECYYTQICVKENTQPIYIDPFYSQGNTNSCYFFSGIPEDENSFLRISPNPANDKIELVATTIPQQSRIYIYDLEGRKVFDAEVSNQSEIVSIQDLNEGIYQVVVSDKKYTWRQKLIISR